MWRPVVSKSLYRRHGIVHVSKVQGNFGMEEEQHSHQLGLESVDDVIDQSRMVSRSFKPIEAGGIRSKEDAETCNQFILLPSIGTEKLSHHNKVVSGRCGQGSHL